MYYDACLGDFNIVTCAMLILFLVNISLFVGLYKSARHAFTLTALEIINKSDLRFYLFNPYDASALNLPRNYFSLSNKTYIDNYNLLNRLYDLSQFSAFLCTGFPHTRDENTSNIDAIHKRLINNSRNPVASFSGIRINQSTYKMMFAMNGLLIYAIFISDFLFAPGMTAYSAIAMFVIPILQFGPLFFRWALYSVYQHAFAAAYYYILMDEWPWEKGK